MSSELALLREEYTAVTKRLQTMAFITRDATLQEEALEDSSSLNERLGCHKAMAVQSQDEQSANEVLLMELLLEGVTSQVRMWLALKRHAPEEAWGHLVDAQGSCLSAISVRRQLSNGPDPARLDNLQAWLETIEATVFPPQAFLSIGGRAHQRECSICGLDYDECGHIRGRAYWGQLCHTIIREMAVDEVSIVLNPANKRCRVTHFSEHGRRRNKMTWRLEAPVEPEPEPPAA
jgi:hypothetical protein